MIKINVELINTNKHPNKRNWEKCKEIIDITNLLAEEFENNLFFNFLNIGEKCSTEELSNTSDKENDNIPFSLMDQMIYIINFWNIY